jgi:hypothetical protein
MKHLKLYENFDQINKKETIKSQIDFILNVVKKSIFPESELYSNVILTYL